MFSGIDYIVVGAGLFGAVVAERLASQHKKVCVLEKRNHIGGNCYDEYDQETGVLVHTYGPHIFHSSNDNVLSYIQKFTSFNRYFHQVVAYYRGRIYQLPFNLETINSFYGKNLRPYELKAFLDQEIAKENIISPQNMEEKAISLIGRPLYAAFVREYTIKQWGRDPKELPASIIQRIPVRNNYNECYYNKNFHGLPCDGYHKMFMNMLSHEGIVVKLNTDFFAVRNQIPSKVKIVFTGPIDSYFNYKFGKLEYRKVTFVREVHRVRDWQGTSVINYPELEYKFTRICEPRHFYLEKWDNYSPDATVIFKEFPSADNGEDPYYPINDTRNTQLAEQYKKEAASLTDVYFGGRLGEYKYYDMDDAIRSALAMADAICSDN